MATGIAKGAESSGKKIAFGDGKRIIWGPHSEEIFRGNPNIARPGTEASTRINRWYPYYKGHRIYNKLGNGRWIWNYEFKARPGEMFFDGGELEMFRQFGINWILIEPNVPQQKTCAPNKDWGLARYQAVADALIKRGHRVSQFAQGHRLHGVRQIPKTTFRNAMAVMRHAKMAILPEGGLHHACAALGIPAVVIFGGFVPPLVTGYDLHTNLVGNSMEACGLLSPCLHCRRALDAISVDEVLAAAEQYL